MNDFGLGTYWQQYRRFYTGYIGLNFEPVLISDWIHYSSDWNTLFHYQYFVYSNNINYLQCRNLNKLLNQF